MEGEDRGTVRSLFGLVRAFLNDFFRESIAGTKRHKKGVVLFLSFAFIVFFAFLVAAYKISEAPMFCSVCHNMKVYVDSWRASSHRNVGCVDCHYKPGFKNHLVGKWKDGQVSLVYFVTGKVVTRPHAEIDDASCLQSGCHKREDLDKDIIFKNVVFSHKHHLETAKREKQLRCTTCHSQIVQGAHITVTDVECFICHFYKTKTQKAYTTGCTSCHFEAKGDINVGGSTFNHKKYVKRGTKCESCHTNVVTGDGRIQENACLRCHNKREIVEAKYTAETLHRNHVTDHKVECFSCHSPIRHQIRKAHTPEVQTGECASCHAERTHGDKVLMFLGKGAKGVREMPDRKAMLNMDCAVCHRSGKSAAQATDTCKDCHGHRTDGMVQRWKKLMKAGEEGLAKGLTEAQGMAQKKAGEAAWKKSLDEALLNRGFLAGGNAVHNILYGMEITSRTNELLAGLKGGPSIQAGKPAKGPAAAKVNCARVCHSDVGEKKVPFGKVWFVHDVHVENDESCAKCHGPYSDHGTTTVKDCSKCHHGKGEGKVSCGDCHSSEAEMLKAKGTVHGKVDCVACHRETKEGKKGTIPGLKENCATCHRKGQAAKIDEWANRYRDIIGKYQVDMAAAEKDIAAVEAKDGKYSVPLRKYYDEMREEMRFLMRARYAHNPVWAEAMIGRKDTNLEKLNRLMKHRKTGKTLVIN
jgi:hypothetical protein